MAGFIIDKFRGLAPRFSPRALPEGLAEVAHNVRLSNNQLRPMAGVHVCRDGAAVADGGAFTALAADIKSTFRAEVRIPNVALSPPAGTTSGATLPWPQDTATIVRFPANTPVTVTTGGVLPSGLLPDTIYYATLVDSSTPAVVLSATVGGAPVTITTVGTGTITLAFVDDFLHPFWFIDTDGEYSRAQIANVNDPYTRHVAARREVTGDAAYPQLIAFEDGVKNEYRLGLPAPSAAPELRVPYVPEGTSPAEIEYISYIATYTDKFGYEGPPSAPTPLTQRVRPTGDGADNFAVEFVSDNGAGGSVSGASAEYIAADSPQGPQTTTWHLDCVSTETTSGGTTRPWYAPPPPPGVATAEGTNTAFHIDKTVAGPVAVDDVIIVECVAEGGGNTGGCEVTIIGKGTRLNRTGRVHLYFTRSADGLSAVVKATEMLPNDVVGDGYNEYVPSPYEYTIARGQAVAVGTHPAITITVKHDGGRMFATMDSVYIDFTTDGAGAVDTTKTRIQYGAGRFDVTSVSQSVTKLGARAGRKYGSASGKAFQFLINPATGPRPSGGLFGSTVSAYAPARKGETFYYYIQREAVVTAAADVQSTDVHPGWRANALASGSDITGYTFTVGTMLGATPFCVGMVLSGPGVAADTVITANVSGAGSGSIWTVDVSHTGTGSITIGGEKDLSVEPVFPRITAAPPAQHLWDSNSAIGTAGLFNSKTPAWRSVAPPGNAPWYAEVTTAGSGGALRFAVRAPIVDTFTAVGVTTDVFTVVAHRMVTGLSTVSVLASGTVPVGTAVGTTYYAIVLTADTFSLAASAEDALAGVAISIATTTLVNLVAWVYIVAGRRVGAVWSTPATYKSGVYYYLGVGSGDYHLTLTLHAPASNTAVVGDRYYFYLRDRVRSFGGGTKATFTLTTEDYDLLDNAAGDGREPAQVTTISAVDATADTVTFAAPLRAPTSTVVRFSGGGLPAGLSAGVDYYLLQRGAAVATSALSLTDNGPTVDITSTTTGATVTTQTPQWLATAGVRFNNTYVSGRIDQDTNGFSVGDSFTSQIITTSAVQLTFPAISGLLEKYHNLIGGFINIYRSNMGSTAAAFQFARRFPIAAGSGADTVAPEFLQEVCPSATWIAPPDDATDPDTGELYYAKPLQKIVQAPGGVLVGYTGRVICFSEPGLPHAWPAEYRTAVRYDIVDLCPIRDGVLVLTVGAPILLVGEHPGAMGQIALDARYGCINPRSVVAIDGEAYYAAREGLIRAGSSGVTNLTAEYIDEATWRADFLPDEYYAFTHEGRYIAQAGVAGVDTFSGCIGGASHFIVAPVEQGIEVSSASATAGLHIYAPSMLALFTAMVPAPTTAEKDRVYDTVMRLEAAGYWSRFDRFGIMGGLSYAQQRLIDWKNPTKSITLHGAATCTQADGFVGAHSAGSFGATGFNAATDGVNYTLNSASICAYVTHLDHHGEPYGAAIAGDSGLGRLTYHPDYGNYSANVNSYGAVKNIGVSAIPPTGLIAAIRYSASGALANGIYVNGVLISNYGNDAVSDGVPNVEMYLGAWNLGGSYLSSEVNVSAWWAGGMFTSAEQLEIKAIIDDYLASF